ncbi:MAG TPA: serpin family protein [Solirubrobacteraceae bacterium]|nr:serpin family protein [Solirubrobacteraceae bacterium]
MPTATASFALRLLDRLGSGQIVLSPASIHRALMALRPGVTGGAAAALDEVLGPPPEVDNLDGDGIVLVLAQAIWIDHRREVVADLGIDVEKIDFGDPSAPERVNAWAAEHTRGMIPKVIDEFQRDEVFALTDAIYFDGAWTDPFDAEKTKPRGFTRPDGETVEVPTMHAEDSFQYFEDDDVQAVRLPYGNDGDICFVAVIARDGLEPPTVRDWDALQTRNRRGTITLPRFRAASNLELGEQLTALGLGPVFSAGRDFDGLFSGGEPKALGRVLHSALVDVDERGTRAAAVTVVTAIATAYRPEPPFELRLDRPFLWAIEDRRTGTLLFLGIVTDPTQTPEEST